MRNGIQFATLPFTKRRDPTCSPAAFTPSSKHAPPCHLSQSRSGWDYPSRGVAPTMTIKMSLIALCLALSRRTSSTPPVEFDRARHTLATCHRDTSSPAVPKHLCPWPQVDPNLLPSPALRPCIQGAKLPDRRNPPESLVHNYKLDLSHESMLREA